MTELRPLDAGFVELEDSDRHISLGIGVVAILAGPPPSRAEFTATLAERLAVDPRLRQRMRRTTLDLAIPSWEEDPAFDIAHHVRWIALPEPSDEDALCDVVAGEVADRLDRDHPLWRCTVVERLAGDRWAILLMAHHSVLDGVSGIGLLTGFCDPRAAAETPSATADSADGGSSADWYRRMMSLARLPIDLPLGTIRTVRGLLPVMSAFLSATEGSTLIGAIGQQRRYTVTRAALDDIREIGHAFDATVNDVVLAVITAGYRALLLHRGEDPTPDKLRILVPVSTRAADAKSVLDNRVSAVLPLLPVHVGDPVERLAVISGRMRQHKARGEAAAESSLLGLAGLLPFAPLGWAVRLVARLPQNRVTAVATNVPGPRAPLTFAGRAVLELLPIVPIAVRLRTGIAILSYTDQLTFGLTGDYDTVPDLRVIAAGIDSAVAELLRAARAA
ncbi:wax ester/triacylglycerol synthase family O-acyltransferase [Nocardia inohanensis]|uniref:wax ester/triacylglycerol synthase family O-acyltransferase n=1 Tax=Nocardia inohanensis TaxID=209246 RepID=UPI00082E5DF1|nr:wax ester/triacylglycerol synthase family O-acyltransferase [Nocardia inohanensis]